MESENESSGKDVNVKELQAALFPPTPKSTTSFFSNFLIKANIHFEDDRDENDEDKSKSLSRELFYLSRETNFVPQSPRWPTECQVLDERIKHIEYVPPNPEPYYKVTSKEVQPKPTGDECGIIVYQYTPISAVNYFSRSNVGGSKYLLNSSICPEEDSLRFESRFESGNLAKAIRITPNYYELYLRADLYTNRHMQWFYFKITNMKKNFPYRFAIVNFSKEDSLYNEGMRPLMYSVKDSEINSVGWRRFGDNITYYSNDNVTPEDPEAQMTYTLTFTTEFAHEEDEVFFAHSYPYTYSDLEDYLMDLSNHPIKSSFTTVRLLCRTLAGNSVHYITITSPPTPGEMKKKRAVVITARVHPGETPASWMMKGFLDFLTSDCNSAKELREKFIFKLVPMLNPDGVIVGNNRCSLSAKDLNRQYRTVMREAYPSIWYTKLMVRRLLEECGVAMYCDLHAHSRRHNIFVYGCENRRGADRKLQEQVFPLMLHKNAADKFSFESCKFRIQKTKEGTGRVVMWMMGIANSYTMEASFAGSTMGTRGETHFSTLDFETMGKSFCQTLLDFYDEDPKKEKLRVKIISRLVKEGSNADEPANIRLSDYSSDEGDTSSASSNEVGRDYDDIIYPAVPPPSPALHKRLKPKVVQSKKKILSKSSNAPRKPLPICKATLGLTIEERKAGYTSDSSTDSEDIDLVQKQKQKKRQVRRKLRKKTKSPNKPNQEAVYVTTYSDCEILYKETTIRSISVFDLLPTDKIKTQNCTKRSKTPQPRVERKNSITARQLSQVQAKLLSLKSKLWLGVNEGDTQTPLSWGDTAFNFPKHSNKKQKKKNGPTRDKVLKKQSTNDTKMKTEHTTASKKSQNGLRRQTALDWSASVLAKIKKSKSLPDSSFAKNDMKCKKGALSCGEEEKPEVVRKKRGKKSKFAKKAKTVSNARIFLHRD